jgi:DNA-directed RNA polymerase specialized sigma24 family protein
VGGRLESLRRSAYVLCRDWHQADDLVQATATKLFVGWPRARRADNLGGYVQTILVR